MTKIIAALLAFATTAIAQDFFQINTPTHGVVTCEPLRVTWLGGTPPYTLTLRTPTGPVDLGVFDGTSAVWTVNQTPGTQIGFDIVDSDGNLRQTADFSPSAGAYT